MERMAVYTGFMMLGGGLSVGQAVVIEYLMNTNCRTHHNNFLRWHKIDDTNLVDSCTDSWMELSRERSSSLVKTSIREAPSEVIKPQKPYNCHFDVLLLMYSDPSTQKPWI